MESPKTNVWQQYYATIIGTHSLFYKKSTFAESIKTTFFSITVNLLALTQGCSIGWLSSALPQLTSQTTSVLSEPLSSVAVSWLGSISCIGAIIGAISFCYFVGQVGAKKSALVSSIPFACMWLLIYFGDNVTYILCARFVGGFAGGGPDILILFISEIANDKYVLSIQPRIIAQ